MNILKVVVDKLPKGCEDCLFKAQSWTGVCWSDVCDLEGLELYHLDQRPKWCPLVEEGEECQS
jgi:hypothetical protein